MSDPEVLPRLWDSAVIGGVKTPGLCAVKGSGREIGWDEAKGTGSTGAVTRYTGDPLQKFEANWRFADGVGGLTAVEQRARWNAEVIPQLEKAFTGKTALDFYHPAVSEPPYGVRAAVPQNIGYLTDDGEVFSITVKFLEFRKPKPAVGKPKSAAAKPGQQTTAKDAADKEIEALMKQVKALA